MEEQFNRADKKRWFSQSFRIAAMICLGSVLLMAQSSGITVNNRDQKAQEAVDAALKALGGADKINGIKSLIIKGTSVSYDNAFVLKYTNEPTTQSVFEIRILWPDSFLRILSITDGRVITLGVSNGKLIMDSPSISAKMNAGATDSMLAEWTAFSIGTLMKAGPKPLTISSRSKPGNLKLSIRDLPDGELEIDPNIAYPSYAGYSFTNKYEASGGPREIQFSNDRFPVSGIMFPREIIRTTSGGSLFMRIEEVLINPELTLKDFEIPKR